MIKMAWICFSIIAGLASIVSAVFLFNQNIAHIHILLIIFFVSLLLAYIAFKSYQLGFFSKEEMHVLMNLIRWTIYKDGTSIYEVRKIVKCKKIFIGTHKFNHTWSGRGEAIIDQSGSASGVSVTYNTPDIEVYYPLCFCFGETRIVNYRLKLNDTGNKQRDFINLNGKKPVGIIRIEVILPDEEEKDRPNAKIAMNYKESDEHATTHSEVKFDSAMRAYNWEYFNFPGDQKILMKW
jgi:hypothetical protein